MLIAIAGAIGAGKSAIAARLAERYGFRVVTFADALREEVLARLPLTLRALHDGWDGCMCAVEADDNEQYEHLKTLCIRRCLYETKPRGFRELLQEYGSDVRRADDPDYWVKRWAATVGPLLAAGQHVVSPDCRFPNEARAVRSLGTDGQLWRVERPGCVGTGHVSETALAGWFDYDAVLVNDGTLVDLYVQIEQRLRPRAIAQGDGAWL
jgi:hypothetical protein